MASVLDRYPSFRIVTKNKGVFSGMFFSRLCAELNVQTEWNTDYTILLLSRPLVIVIWKHETVDEHPSSLLRR